MTRVRTEFLPGILLAWCIGCGAPAPVGPVVHGPIEVLSEDRAAAAAAQVGLPQAPAPRELVYFELTPAAERAVLAHMNDIRREPGPKYDRLWFRFEMTPGGCTGLQHKLWIDSAPPQGDAFEYHAGPVPCQFLKGQRELVQGTRIDFTTKDGKTGFVVTDPHVTQKTKTAVAQWLRGELEPRPAPVSPVKAN